MSDAEIVRIATAGSVDDGKSTLIGRLLHDSGAILDDQYEALERSSRLSGESQVNLALLTDGLRAEREAKITIDVAYRYFSTEKRRFILADTPGHPQYTRNMVTGASNADVALLLVDVRNGMTAQSKRHAFIASLLRVPHVLVVVNKMDLVRFDEKPFKGVVDAFRAYSEGLAISHLMFVPVAALTGDNVVLRSELSDWYYGPTVLQYLESVDVRSSKNRFDFRFPVQCVIRPNAGFRGYAGQAASGGIRVGEDVMALPGGQVTTVARIDVLSSEVREVNCDSSAVISLSDELDLSRGDMLVRPRNPARVTDRLEAMVCWMLESPLELRKSYRMLHTTRDVACRIEELVYKIDVEELHRQPATRLTLNEIGRIVLCAASPLPIDLFEQNRTTGSFILVDPDSNRVAAAGMIVRTFDTRDRTSFLPELRAGAVANGRGLVVWLTGLSGAGKSTLSDLLKAALADRGIGAIQLDGDALRSGLCKDLAFTEEARTENIRRAGEIAKLLCDQGYVVLCSFISPQRAQRELARATVGDPFMEVHIDCTVDEAKRRDPKGLYARALAGEIPHFTGVSAGYESPEAPDLRIDTGIQDHDESLAELLRAVLEQLNHRLA